MLPSFTIQTLAGGVLLHRHGDPAPGAGLVLENVTDELYAEFTNASFFRPEPGRNLILTSSGSPGGFASRGSAAGRTG